MEGEVDAEGDQQLVALFEALFENEFVDFLLAAYHSVVAEISEQIVSFC